MRDVGTSERQDLVVDSANNRRMAARLHPSMQPQFQVHHVEGPSDVMYLELWLHAWVKAGGHPPIVRGIDYEILPFGGANVAHIDFAHEFSAEDVKRLINLLNVHR